MDRSRMHSIGSTKTGDVDRPRC